MTFLRYLGKSVRPKVYPCTVRCIKRFWGSGAFFISGVFILKKSLWMLFLGPFPHAKTTNKLPWNSKNVTNITKALNLVSTIFYQFLIFNQTISLQKLWKMFFISSKKLFLFLRYSNFCSFFPSFPHFPDTKGQM